MKKVILFLISSIVFQNCTEPAFDGQNCLVNCITFSGTIKEARTQKGVPNAEVKLIYKQLSGFVLQPILCTTKTDERGNFSLTFDGTNFKVFSGYMEIQVKKEGFLTGEIEGKDIFSDIDSTKFGTVIPVNIGIYPSANLKIRLRIASQDVNKFIDIEHKYAHTRYGFYSKPQIPIDTVMNIKTAGNQFVIIQSRVSASNRVISNKIDSIFIKAGETGSYLLEY